MRKKANLGEDLEQLLTTTCEMYQRSGTAVLQKVPTPYRIVGTTKAGKLLAVPDDKSTVDYIGLWGSRPIALEAKRTSNKTSYRLDPWEREAHQRDFLTRWQWAGGIAGYVIGFARLGEVYFVPFGDYVNWWSQSRAGGRKSIPLRWFRERAYRLKATTVPLDVLQAIGEWMKEGNVMG